MCTRLVFWGRSPRARRALPLVLGSALAACAGTGRPAAPSAQDELTRGVLSHGSARRLAPPSPVLADYTARWDAGAGVLSVQGHVEPGAGAWFSIEPGVDGYVVGLEVAPEHGAWQRAPLASEPGERGERGESLVRLAPCERSRCRLRYRVELARAARELGDLAGAGMLGDVLVAPPSTWLIAPAPGRGAPAMRVRFAVHTEGAQRFVTGAPRARGVDGTWELELSDLWTSPYSGFGELASYRLEVPAPGGAPPRQLEVAVSTRSAALAHDELVRWVGERAAAVAGYWRGFPMDGALVLVAITGGAQVGGGRTLSGGGGAVVLAVGERADARVLDDDWVLTHELVHLSFPALARRHLWAEEGLATYVEPLARVRAGLLDEGAAWSGLVDGLPYAFGPASAAGLDGNRAWAPTYWGGALFWFLADVELWRRTDGRLGLEDALRAVAAEPGGDNATRWPIDEVFSVADRALGVEVLAPLYRELAAAPPRASQAALLRELGVSRRDGQVVLDDRAPLAAVRRAIMHGTASAQGERRHLR